MKNNNIQPTKKNKKFKTKVNKHLFKRWWFGVSKELKRFTYKDKKGIVVDLIVIVFVCLIIGSILFGFDLVLIKIK